MLGYLMTITLAKDIVMIDFSPPWCKCKVQVIAPFCASVTINTCQHVVSHHLHHLQFGTCTKMVLDSLPQKTPPSVVPKVLLD